MLKRAIPPRARISILRLVALFAPLFLFPFSISLAQIGLSNEELPVQLTRPDASLQFRSLDVSTGMPDDHVGAMIQDSKGFIWTGGFSGLVRYDGYDYRVYEHDPDDPTSMPDIGAIASIVETSDNKLWVGGWNSDGPARFDPKTERFERFEFDSTDVTTISSGGVRAILEDSRGNLWIGTAGNEEGEGGLNLFDPETNTFRRFQHDPDDPNSISVSSVVLLSLRIWRVICGLEP